MLFRIASAPEVFQQKIHEIIEELIDVEVIADDFIATACGDPFEEAVRIMTRIILLAFVHAKVRETQCEIECRKAEAQPA